MGGQWRDIQNFRKKMRGFIKSKGGGRGVVDGRGGGCFFDFLRGGLF